MAVTIEHCRRPHPWADVLPTLLPDSTEPDTVDEMVPRELLNIKNQLIHLVVRRRQLVPVRGQRRCMEAWPPSEGARHPLHDRDVDPPLAAVAALTM